MLTYSTVRVLLHVHRLVYCKKNGYNATYILSQCGVVPSTLAATPIDPIIVHAYHFELATTSGL